LKEREPLAPQILQRDMDRQLCVHRLLRSEPASGGVRASGRHPRGRRVVRQAEHAGKRGVEHVPGCRVTDQLLLSLVAVPHVEGRVPAVGVQEFAGDMRGVGAPAAHELVESPLVRRHPENVAGHLLPSRELVLLCWLLDRFL